MQLGSSEHAPSTSTFVVLQVSGDGLARKEGKKTYRRESEAIESAKKHAAEIRGTHFTVLKVMGTYWQTPKPEILTDVVRNLAVSSGAK